MQQAELLAARIRSVRQLREVVAAMRSMAATQSQRAGAALPAVRAYRAVVREAIDRAAALAPADATRAPAAAAPGRECAHLVVFASEHGFVGGFNDIVARAAIAAIARRPAPCAVTVVGTRGAALAREHGLAADHVVPMAGTLRGAPDVARQLTELLDADCAADATLRLETLVARLSPGGVLRAELATLLPLEAPAEPALAAPPPVAYLPAAQLARALLGELLVAHLSQCVVESFAAENVARLHAMELAHHRVTERLGALERDANRLRQETITAELLELDAGARAVRDR